MTVTPTEPKKNLNIRYAGLGLAVVLGIGLWSGVWAYGRSLLAHELEAQIERFAADGLDVTCNEQGIAGYPFRYEVTCSSLTAASSLGANAELGPLQAVALVYNPRHIIFETGGPLALQSPVTGETVNGEWDLARSSVQFSGNQLRKFDAVLETLRFELSNPGADLSLQAAKAGAHARLAEDDTNDAELFLSLDGVSSGQGPAGLPPADARLHVRIANGAGLMAGATLFDLPRDPDGNLPFEIVLASLDLAPARVGVSGGLALQPNGYVSGALTVSVTDIEAAARYAGLFLPPDSSLAASLDGMAKSLGQSAASTGAEGAVEFPVVISNGAVRIGFLPVGQIPPVFPAGF